MQARLSITRACQIACLSRAAYYKRPTPASKRDAPVIDALNAIVTRHGRWEFWRCFTRLRLDGRCWNKKRVYRVYCDMGLNLPRRSKKRLPERPRQPLDLATEPNRCWALDFMHDARYCGRRFRTLNVVDEANRERLAIEVGMSIPSARLIRVLSRLIDCYGPPDAIRLDNGPEMISDAFTEWAAAKGIRSAISNRESRIRTPLSSASIALIAPKCSMHTASALRSVSAASSPPKRGSRVNRVRCRRPKTETVTPIGIPAQTASHEAALERQILMSLQN